MPSRREPFNSTPPRRSDARRRGRAAVSERQQLVLNARFAAGSRWLMLNRLLRPPLDGAISLAPQGRAPVAPRRPTDPRVGEGGRFGLKMTVLRRALLFCTSSLRVL